MFVKTVNKKMMPVNPEEKTLLIQDSSSSLFMVVKGYEPHWVSCPKGDRFRQGA